MITLHKGQYLSDVMSEIPSNCILSKNRNMAGHVSFSLNINPLVFSLVLS